MLQRVVTGAVAPLRDRLFRVKVQRQRAQRMLALTFQPVGQGGQGPGLPIRVDQDLVGIQRQAPVPVAVPQHQPGQPVHPETRGLVAGAGLPQRHVRLPDQPGGAAVRAAVVDNQELPDAQLAVMLQHEGKPLAFVAHTQKAQDVAPADFGGSIDDRVQLAAAADRPRQKHPAPGAQPIGTPKTGCRHGLSPGQQADRNGVGRHDQGGYCAAFCMAISSCRNAANSVPRSGRARPKATVACRKPALVPQS